MHFRCVFTLLQWCVLVGLDWAKLMMFLSLYVTCSCIFHPYIHSFIYILILICVGAFLHVSLSLSLFLFVSCSMAPKRKFTPSQNPLHSGPSSSSLSNSTPSHVRFRNDKAHKEFSKNFSYEAFIRNAKSFYRIFPILTFPLSCTVEVGSHCVASQSLVPLWSYRSFTLTCTDSILQYLILSLVFEVRAL